MGHKGYRHLTHDDRCQIHALKKSGLCQSEIARQIGVDKGTISREIHRNGGGSEYCFEHAQNLSSSRRHTASSRPTKMTPECIAFIEEKLVQEQWSPEQISGRMKLMFGNSISHERIYQHIWEDKKFGGTLYKHLRHHGKKYNKRKGCNAGRGLIPNRVDIDERPKIVDEKQRIGDWELDTIIGKNHDGAIVSMVERKSKFTKLILVPNKTAAAVTSAIISALIPLKSAVTTMTADNGKEFAMHEDLTRVLDAQVYFAKPYHSWERGLNEHTNGLVRQYFPKGTRFDTLRQEDVQKVEDLLNARPRKAINFQMPVEVFFKPPWDETAVALQA
jgi:transposase, IS30 family